jgi:hypothetical protein
LSNGEWQLNDAELEVANAFTIATMAEYALRIAQDKHASATRKFHTLKSTFFQLAKTSGRVRFGARELCTEVGTYIHVSNVINPSMCQHGGHGDC